MTQLKIYTSPAKQTSKNKDDNCDYLTGKNIHIHLSSLVDYAILSPCTRQASVPFGGAVHQEGAVSRFPARHHPHLQGDGGGQHSREPAALPLPGHPQGQSIWEVLPQAL